jgi:hypothetical protein
VGYAVTFVFMEVFAAMGRASTSSTTTGIVEGATIRAPQVLNVSMECVIILDSKSPKLV